jgi:hypothetical protein
VTCSFIKVPRELTSSFKNVNKKVRKADDTRVPNAGIQSSACVSLLKLNETKAVKSKTSVASGGLPENLDAVESSCCVARFSV